jgi:hypothetical protein
MKKLIVAILFFQLLTCCFAQKSLTDSLYQKAMESYNAQKYPQSASLFDNVFSGDRIADPDIFYNASCVYSLTNETQKAFLYLTELADVYLFADLERLNTDTDFDNLHAQSEWKFLVEKVTQNKQTLPQRRRTKIQTELLKTKKLLNADNGKLWNGNIWSENILVLDENETIYTLNSKLANTQNDSLLYYKQIPEKTLLHVNTNQQFEEEKWAIVQNYDVTPSDSCQTPIHELFHLFHSQQMNIGGNIVEYLDHYKAKILISTEFEALRNCIKSIQKNNETEAAQFLSDAVYFRTKREKLFRKQNHFALELETLEGLASYTGYKLSAYKDLYRIALYELNGRENPTGLNRSFAYATGLAYGLIFDYFKIQWRTDLKHIYSFSAIYKQQRTLKQPTIQKLKDIQTRNKYDAIEQEEMARKTTNDIIRIHYENIFGNEPFLEVMRDTADKTYFMSFDMNSTFTLGKQGIVYSDIASSSSNPLAFGNFKTTGETIIGKTGILITSNFDKLTFPKPLKIQDNIVTGENYSIELNQGWTVKQKDKKGNLEIVKE